LPDDGNRYEVLDGALLVTPQARFGHQEIATRLLVSLRAFCDAHRIGVVLGPGAVPHGKSELQPDVQVILGRIALGSNWIDLPTPALVVEVLSESTRRRDLGIKRDAYLAWGIPEYWAVDAEARAVHVFTPAAPEGIVVADTLRWVPREGVPEFTLDLADLFAETAG
jgi:Uma2 family endonuclease